MLLWRGLASSTLHVKFLPRRTTRNRSLSPFRHVDNPPFNLSSRRSSMVHPILSSSSSCPWMEACIPLTSAEENVSIRGGRENGRGRDGLSAREQCHCASPRRSASDGTLHTKGIGQPIIFRTVFRAFDSCTTLAPFLETFGIFCSSKNSADRKLAGCVPNAIRASTTRPGRQKATVKIVFEGNTPRVLFLFDGVVESGRFLL